MSATWPTNINPDATAPNDTYGSAIWLIKRHPDLTRLLARIPGAVEIDAAGTPDAELAIELDLIGDALAEIDTARLVQDRGFQPNQLSPAAAAIVVMSRSEQVRLRLLAAFGMVRVPFRTSELDSLDDSGRALLADWCAAIQAR